ncbi:MAG: hypothetical protein E3J73_01075 [Candidatus Bathyarchaeum sp.]|nr:MAG: hypothetical protein E3J73_01075 [Candidatus Bathyarchaeum sp.]
MRSPIGFYNVTRRLLQERLTNFLSGKPNKETDIRHFFYECRNKYLRENPDRSEVDSNSKKDRVYGDWQKCMKEWCKKHAEELGFTPDLWWRVREKLNIWAEGRAICEGEMEKFLIDRETRHQITQGSSFVLLCEKKTVSKELLKNLQQLGYRINLVSTGGNNPSDVQESIIKIAEDLAEQEDTNFYVLALHDYDISGVQIFFTLAKRYNQVIDIGVNGEFIKYLKSTVGLNERLVVEKVKNKCNHDHLKKLIAESEGYSPENFRWLQGEQVSEKEWVGRRIEIDAVHVEYGIQPFIDFIQHQLEEYCKYWDLTRIGVEEFYLDEPSNPFGDANERFTENISEKSFRTEIRLCKPIDRVVKLAKTTATQFLSEFWDLKRLNKMEVEKNKDGVKMTYSKTVDDASWTYSSMVLNREDFVALKEKYRDGFERKYAPDFEYDLNELNAEIHRYEGDITTAIEDVEERFEDIQTDVNDKAEMDDEAIDFENELSKIDWGESELDKLEVPDEKQILRAVIEELQGRLDVLEML